MSDLITQFITGNKTIDAAEARFVLDGDWDARNAAIAAELKKKCSTQPGAAKNIAVLTFGYALNTAGYKLNAVLQQSAKINEKVAELTSRVNSMADMIVTDEIWVKTRLELADYQRLKELGVDMAGLTPADFKKDEHDIVLSWAFLDLDQAKKLQANMERCLDSSKDEQDKLMDELTLATNSFRKWHSDVSNIDKEMRDNQMAILRDW